MNALGADLFFIAYALASPYLYWYVFQATWVAGGPPRLGRHAALFADPSELLILATIMTVGCVLWSHVYAAEQLIVGRTRLLWQLGVLLLPALGPLCFYFFVLRRRHPSVQPAPWSWKTAMAVVLSGGLVGVFGMLVAARHSEATQMTALIGGALVGGMWGFRFWTGRPPRIHGYFSAIRASTVAGAVYGITVHGLLLPGAAGLGTGVWEKPLIAIASVYWGAAEAAFATCAIVVIPGLLGAELKRLHQVSRRRTIRTKDVRDVQPRA